MIKEWSLWVMKVIAFSTVESKSRSAIRDLIIKHKDSKDDYITEEGTAIDSYNNYLTLY